MNPKLSEDIRLAIGERSYGQVAVATGISKSTLSRMVNQTYKRAISPSLLWKLSATAQNNMTFELLMMPIFQTAKLPNTESSMRLATVMIRIQPEHL